MRRRAPAELPALASPERHLVFDINDFDETLPGPFEWDVKRLAASLVVAGRANDFTGSQCDDAVRACVRSYRDRMRAFAGMRTLDVWYARDDIDQVEAMLSQRLDRDVRQRVSRASAKARGRTSLEAAGKLTRLVDGAPRIVSDPPLITPSTNCWAVSHARHWKSACAPWSPATGAALSSERRHLLSRFHVVDMARKVVGVGSVGTRCWIVLLLGRDGGDPLVLQAKEAGESVLAASCGPSPYVNQGERVVAGQRLAQAAGDIFLGWQRVPGIDGRGATSHVRQLWDWKGIARPETMDPATLALFGRLCGATLARAHARSGDPVAIGAYLGRGDRFDRALVEFAQAYADQNARDHRALADAVADGRLSARAA